LSSTSNFSGVAVCTILSANRSACDKYVALILVACDLRLEAYFAKES
jgi:hypothetical protein